MAHVLEDALRGLDVQAACRVLETIAAIRMPPSYDTLAALFVGENGFEVYFPAYLVTRCVNWKTEDCDGLGQDR